MFCNDASAMRLGFIAAFAMIAGALAREGVLSVPLAFLAFAGMVAAYYVIDRWVSQSDREAEARQHTAELRQHMIGQVHQMSKDQREQLFEEARQRLGPSAPTTVPELVDWMLATRKR